MVLTDVVHVNTNNCIYDMQMPCKCKSLKFTRLNFLHLYCCCAHTCIYIYIYIYIYISYMLITFFTLFYTIV
jgi:hypothetical protein